jgi:MoxR-like ATPase
LTSNGTRELSEALKRRCLYLYLDYPSLERERAIVAERVEGITTELADEVVRVVSLLRSLELQKHPSISETLDWARTLVLLGIEHVDAETTTSMLNLLLKYKSDIDLATKELSGSASRH